MALATLLLFPGCLALQIGGGAKSEARQPSLGQQLVDLKKARDTGAITDAEYEAQKARLMHSK